MLIIKIAEDIRQEQMLTHASHYMASFIEMSLRILSNTLQNKH
jgi:hypothetical protein